MLENRNEASLNDQGDSQNIAGGKAAGKALLAAALASSLLASGAKAREEASASLVTASSPGSLISMLAPHPLKPMAEQIHEGLDQFIEALLQPRSIIGFNGRVSEPVLADKLVATLRSANKALGQFFSGSFDGSEESVFIAAQAHNLRTGIRVFLQELNECSTEGRIRADKMSEITQNALNFQNGVDQFILGVNKSTAEYLSQMAQSMDKQG